MAPKYIAFFVFLFIVGSVLGLIIEEGTIGEGETSTLSTLMFWQQLDSEESWGLLQTLGFVKDYFTAMWRVIFWNFAFFEGPWMWVKWIVWIPIAAMAVWGLVMTFVSLIQRVLG